MEAIPALKFFTSTGRLLEKKNFSIPESADEQDQDRVITVFIKDFYAGNPMSVPKEIILPMLPKDSELLLEWLGKQIKGTEVKMIVPERGFKRKLKDMAMAKVNIFLLDKKLQWEYQDARVNRAPLRRRNY